MGSRPEAGALTRTVPMRMLVVAFFVLWAYAVIFGLLAVAVVRLLAVIMGASNLRTVLNVVAVAGAVALGTYLSVPAERATRRFWDRA